MTHGLNPAQKQAVETLSGPMLVLAGAGTGKTRVVTFRIANLIRHGTAPDRILAVTFTNKAAGEMQERIGELIGTGKGQNTRKRKGEPEKPKPTIGTFHSQCVRILRRHAKRIGFPTKFAIYDRSDQESLARSVLRELRLPNTALKPSDLLAIIGGWKNQSILPADAGAVAQTDKEHLAASAYRRYQDGLRSCGAMDFDDLLVHTELLLQSDQEVCEIEAGKYDHVLVDEYQDTNGSQYRIIKSLAEAHRNLCVVGDDDQSIYGWRGADVTHILNFRNDWPDATVVRLEENYRSSGQILEMANRLIRFNTTRHDKMLRPVRSTGQRPRILQLKDEAEESNLVVGEIARLLDRGRYEPRDVAILFRTNEQPRLFETELRKMNVPYVMLGSQSFFDRREIRDLLAYLKWIDQPDDEISLLRVINTPPRGLGNKSVQEIISRAVQSGRPAWQVMCDDTATGDLPVAARRGIDSLRQLFTDVREATLQSLAGAVSTLIERTQYFDEVRRLYNEPEEVEARTNSIQELINAVAAYEDRDKETDLAGFLSETALAGREMGNEKDKLAQRNAVWLLTMHAAKGLEFPVVYMVGMEEGLLPHNRSVKSGDENDIAEERRLCYVGVTRAQETLTLSMALTRRRWGKPRPTTPSRFLYEITGKAENPNKYRKQKKRTV